jgi:hypothetical protein
LREGCLGIVEMSNWQRAGYCVERRFSRRVSLK